MTKEKKTHSKPPNNHICNRRQKIKNTIVKNKDKYNIKWHGKDEN